MQKQRILISECKLKIRGIGKEIADLKRDKYCLEQFIAQDAYIIAARANNLTNKWKDKLKHGQKHKKNMLKALMEVQ